jgi:hypothetical protein
LSPAAGVEAHRLDDERVAVVAADGEAVPFGVHVVAARERAAVEPDFAPIVAVLEDLQDARRRLHELERRVRRDDLGNEVAHEAERLAAPHWVVALHCSAWSIAGLVRIECCAAGRRERRLARAGLLVRACAARRVGERFERRAAVPVAREIARVE